MKFIIHILIFGIFAFVTSLNSIYSVSFKTFIILLAWLFMILFVSSFDWANIELELFFQLILLFAITLKITKILYFDISYELNIFILMLLGVLSFKCFKNNKTINGFCILSVMLLNIININFKMEDTADLSNIFTC